MARIAFGASVGQSLGDGRYVVATGATKSPDTAIAAVQALITAVTDAQTAAEANGTISGDGTALGLVQAIGTAFTALTTALTAAKAASSAADVILDFDTSEAANRNAVGIAVRNLLRAVQAHGYPS